MITAEFVEQFHFNDSTRIACPYCSHERKKTNAKDMTLSRKNDGAVVFYCHHCSTQGSVQPKERKLSAVPNLSVTQNKLEDSHYKWLKTRGISSKTADDMGLFASHKFFGKLNKSADAIGFPYYRNGSLVAVKYRSFPEKDFTQDSGGAHDFFGIDKVEKGKPIIIVEGEIDALTLHEIGISNAVSVPSGAPIKVADGKVLPKRRQEICICLERKRCLESAPYVILCNRSTTHPGRHWLKS
jgi:twinkle protein